MSGVQQSPVVFVLPVLRLRNTHSKKPAAAIPAVMGIHEPPRAC
ncbi:hypothetical protein BKA24_002863 [Microbacterium marinum]|uniref:Uncharacterized protein n=1 Tax=Microbacterium marinum TaxID=421115 RepID=A0A7W7FM93_9MICO|nr:hypothetical protein [Microbacterium marinum]